MTQATKPARRFIAEGRRLRGSDHHWGAYWAFPGMVPKLQNYDHETQEAAALTAKVLLANALINRVRDTAKRERYIPLAPEDFAASLREAGVTLTTFARITGTDQDNVLKWIDGLRPVPHAIRVVLALLLAFPDALEVAEAETARGSVPREGFAEEHPA